VPMPLPEQESAGDELAARRARRRAG